MPNRTLHSRESSFREKPIEQLFVSEMLKHSWERVVEGLRAPARTGTMRFVVQDLAPGRYALSAFHDENDNGELDTNLMGIPSEGYGFGNDASAALGPPSFEAAAVDVDTASGVTALTLAY